MLLLGFSSGLPFYLVYQTLSAWLRTAGIQRTTISMLAWAGMAYTFKFIWAPVVDRVPLPWLTRRLGRRRSWMLFAQMGIAVALFNLSASEPTVALAPIALWAVFLAFCAATQDIAIDAWRIESAPRDAQAAMASAVQFGYRIALIVASAGALTLADRFGWHVSYATMGALVGIGVLTTLLSSEPASRIPPVSFAHEQRVVDWLHHRRHWPRWLQDAGSWFVGAVVCPFSEFVVRHGAPLAAVLLLFMGSYRLSDFTMGVMTNSLYVDRGFTLLQIAAVVKFYGLIASLVGVVVAGVVLIRVGQLRGLLLGSALVILSNLNFSLLSAAAHPTLFWLGLVNAFDNLALAMHGTALIAFLSGLTSPRYTATQYALFTSFYALPAKILEGFSGRIVDHVGYPAFFVYTASLSIPGLLLLAWLVRRGVFRREAATA